MQLRGVRPDQVGWKLERGSGGVDDLPARVQRPRLADDLQVLGRSDAIALSSPSTAAPELVKLRCLLPAIGRIVESCHQF